MRLQRRYLLVVAPLIIGMGDLFKDGLEPGEIALLGPQLDHGKDYVEVSRHWSQCLVSSESLESVKPMTLAPCSLTYLATLMMGR